MLQTNPTPLSLELVPPESEQSVRVLGTPENPLWVAGDLCKVLGHSNPASVLQNFEPDEKGAEKVCTPGGVQTVLVVTEIGLYRMLFRSNKPAARRLQRWVFRDVLPSIRQHGCYPPPAAVPTDSTALVLRELADQRGTNQALAERVEALESQLREITAKATHRYVTIAAYARMKGVLLSQFDAIKHGRELAKLHRAEGVSVGSAPDSRWGRVNSYRLDLVEKYFERRKLTN